MTSPQPEKLCTTCDAPHDTPAHTGRRGPLSEDVAANADAERAYEERQAQKEDRELCTCRDQRAAHSGAPVGMTRSCMVEGCPCKGFHASGDNLEQSLEAMRGGDGDVNCGDCGERIRKWIPIGRDGVVVRLCPSCYALPVSEPKDGLARLEGDVFNETRPTAGLTAVDLCDGCGHQTHSDWCGPSCKCDGQSVALPPDGSPQQRWLGDLRALVAVIKGSYLSDGMTTIDHVLAEIEAKLDAMPAPFDWDAVGRELYAYSFNEPQADVYATTLERLWLGGTRAGD